jgi:mRNA interferase MazF
VSLPADDVAALDEYARRQGVKSRSAAVQRAIRMLRHPDLEQITPQRGKSGPNPASRLPGRQPPATDWPMRRGEIRLVDLEPTRGSDADKRRPAVIVSNDRANATAERLGRGVVTIVPVTSSVSRVFPFQTLLPAQATGLKVDSKAQAEQVRSVSLERVGPVLGRVSGRLLADLDDALRLHLQLQKECLRPAATTNFRREADR